MKSCTAEHHAILLDSPTRWQRPPVLNGKKEAQAGECSSDKLPLAHTPLHNIVGLMHPGATYGSQRVLDMVELD
jgi:hypothetical protein